MPAIQKLGVFIMSLTPEEVRKIGHLARLNLSEQDVARYTEQLSSIFDFITQMESANTDHVEPITHAMQFAQRLRPDVVSEENNRDKFQAIAPAVEAGLYLVPKVIE